MPVPETPVWTGEGEWFSIEVVDAPMAGVLWLERHADDLVRAAVHEGATSWDWNRRPWGVVLEVRFGDEEAWDRFRALPGVQAALDAVPDPVHGLFVYRGRGGGSTALLPRRPRPVSGAGAVALPLPEDPAAMEAFFRPVAPMVLSPSPAG
ncbi:MAG: hypothetical protein ACRD0U_12215 [Acidimicrobiales bacterium]